MEIYKWKRPDYNKYKFNKDIAHHGDIYWYDGNELFYIGNTLFVSASIRIGSRK